MRTNSGIEMVFSGSHCPSKVVYAANPNQGGKCIFSPHISRLSRKKARFTEGSFSFGRAY